MDYDWDSIKIGKPELNSSQNFFRIRHILHEKGTQVEDIQVFKPKQQQQQSLQRQAVKNVGKIRNEAQAEQVTIAANSNQLHDKENVSANYNNRAILAISIVKKPAKLGPKPTMKKSMSVPSSLVASKKPAENSVQVVPQPPAVKKSVNTAGIGQRQFEYAKIQEKRKELLIQKVKAEEEKQLKFNFHANPAPKFKKVPVAVKPMPQKPALMKQSSLPTIPLIQRKVSRENIVPSCGDPERLKYLEEKKKMLMAKYVEPPVQFKAKPAAVLRKQPFQPVHSNFKVVDAKPFKLQLTERLQQRSEYDKKLHETIAIRKKQEEIRQRHQDIVDRKLIRQKTEFKARANPFRNYH